MATQTTKETLRTSTEAATKKDSWARQLTGTSFLTLEHVGYFVLVVLMPMIILASILVAIDMWSGGSQASIMPLMYPSYANLPSLDVTTAMALVASLVTLAPFMYVLRRRTSAEYAKRPGYTRRVAYKLPVYSAVAVLAALTVGSLIGMVAVLLQSLVQIGSGTDIGQLYRTSFVSALLGFVVFGLSGWYALWFAKGKDLTKLFMNAVILLAVVMAVALFVTAMSNTHSGNVPRSMPMYNNLDNFLRY